MALDPSAFGLQNPYVNTTPDQVVGLPQTQQTLQAQHPAETGTGAEDGFTAPGGIAFAATEDDIRRATESEVSPQSTPSAPSTPLQPWRPGGFMSPMTQQTPGSGTTTTAAPGQGTQDPSIWESPNNPYRNNNPGSPESQTVARVQDLQRQKQSLSLEAEHAYNALVAGGMDRDEAQRLVTQTAVMANAQLDRDLMQAQLGPIARQAVTQQIAEHYSRSGIQVTAADLANERTPEAMEARARTIVETRRNSNIQQRQATRVDAVESSSSVAGGALAARPGMSPFELIRSGLRRR